VRFAVGKVALGKVSSEYFYFPYQLSLHQMLHTHLSSGHGILVQLVTDVPSELNFTPPPNARDLSLFHRRGNLKYHMVREVTGNQCLKTLGAVESSLCV
jgi:hypothetical protein